MTHKAKQQKHQGAGGLEQGRGLPILMSQSKHRTGLSVAIPALPTPGLLWPVLVWEVKAGSQGCTAGRAQGGTTMAEAPLCEGIIGTVVPVEANGLGW